MVGSTQVGTRSCLPLREGTHTIPVGTAVVAWPFAAVVAVPSRVDASIREEVD